MQLSLSKNYVYVAVFTANIIAFITGTSQSWSSPILQKLNGTDDNPLGRPATNDERSWISSILAIGALIGPVISGLASQKIGRKPILLSLSVLFLISYVILIFAKTIELFYVSRIIVGLASGATFPTIQMYIGEVAENSNRGLLGASMNSFVTFGLLFSYVVGPYCPFLYFHIILAIFPVFYFIIFFLLAPESPYYLIQIDEIKALSSLKALRGTDNVSQELENIKNSVNKEKEKGSFKDILTSKSLRKGLIITVGLIFFQQFSGIMPVIMFAEDIFVATKSSIPPALGAIIIGVIQFVSSFVTPLMTDRYGRKILLIISHAGMFLAEVPFGVYFYLQQHQKDVTNIGWLPITCLVFYMFFYNVGSAGIPWAILGEVFPSNVKPLASSFTAACGCMFAFFITQFFESLSEAIGMGQIFWIFAGICLVATVFVHFVVIETKGKSLQEIQNELNS